MKKLKLTLTALILALLTACAAGAAGKPDANSGADDGQGLEAGQPSEITIALDSEPSTLHPFDHSAVVCGYMNQMTYNKLFTTDIDTLEPAPELVESYTLSPDGLTWDFKLREGVMFHNGEEMTAEDAAASLDYASTFAFCTRYTSFWSSLEVTGKYSFRITTAQPYSLALYDLTSNAACVLPASLIAKGHDFAARPVGTGAYIFSSRTMGDNIVFEKNGNYFDAEHQPTIDKITWRVVPEGSSRTIGLETGEIDLVMDVEPNDAQRLMDEEGVEVERVDGTRISFMVMNSEKTPFDNADFRRAVNSCIDRQAVVQVATGGSGAPSVSPNPQVYKGSTLENTYDYSPEAAAGFLEKSGVDIESLEITCICYSDETRRSAEVIQGCLREAGITMNIESMDFAAFLSRMLEGDFECAVAGYSSTNMLSYMKGLWHSKSIGASNAARIVDPELDALIELAETQMDEDSRLETLTEICRRTNDLALLAPLYTSSVTRAFSARLQPVPISPSGLMLFQDLKLR